MSIYPMRDPQGRIAFWRVEAGAGIVTISGFEVEKAHYLAALHRGALSTKARPQKDGAA